MDFNNLEDNRDLITVPTETRFHLEKTSNYTKIFSIIGFVMSAIFAMVALGLIVSGPALASFMPDFSGLGGSMALLGSGMFISLGVMCLVVVVLMIFLMLKLFRFSTSVSTSIMKESNLDLELGLKELKTYFVTSGIVAIVTIAMVIFGIVIFGGILMAGLTNL